MLDPNTPVIVGVGQCVERLESPDYRALSTVELAVEAARRACADALDVTRLAPRIDCVGALRSFEDFIPAYATPFGKSNNFPHSVARRLGARPTKAIWAGVGGDTPQRLVSEFCEAIARGACRLALVVGAEAISTARHLIAARRTADWSESIDAPVDDRGTAVDGLLTPYALKHGISTAPDAYALLENARRARLGLSRAAYAAEMGRLFAPFSRVAAANPYSMAPVAYTAEVLSTVTDRNRMIADPYPRLLVARDQVNQSAALLIASRQAARELGIEEVKWIHLLGHSALAERELLDREDLGASPAARLAVKAALDAAGIGVDDVGYFDLYSCFPIAVYNVCDGLGLSPQDPRGLTVTGGLPYFGGPGNNYSTHAIAAIVEKLRAAPGTFGLVGANGGFLSKYAVGVYSTRPAAFRPGDNGPLQAMIDRAPCPPLAYDAEGPATVESYTIVYGRSGPQRGIVAGRLAGTGARFLASTAENDETTLREMVDADPLRRRIHVRRSAVGNRLVFGDLC